MLSKGSMRRFFAFVLIAACNRGSATATATPTPTPTPTATATATSTPTGTPCGELDCTQYASPADAFRQVIAGDPLVLGVGEAHAPKSAAVPSAAKRFAEDLLPLLAGRASDLLVELMMPPSGCLDATAEVRTKQAPVTSRQADTDQNEYIAMGSRGRQLGIIPDMLRPTCADMDIIRRAGDDVVGVSLETIARLSARQAKNLVERDARSEADRDKLVIVYGGAVHNDLSPPPATARWSYAPEVAAAVQGRFVAIDLVVPEFIRDDETWRSLPWWPYYDRARLAAKSTLFRTGDRSFVLVFPQTR